MRVVLDTNILISALLFKERLARIYEAIEYRELTLCFTKATFAEFTNVLQRKKFERVLRRHGIAVREVIDFVRERADIRPTPSSVPMLVPEDVADNQILAAAAAGNAVCIVSGDTHITRLSVFGDIPILTPQQFLEAL